MEKEGYIWLILVSVLASFACGERADSRQFSSKPYYAEESDDTEHHVRFPDEVEISPDDLDAAASGERIQGLQFFAVQNGNMPLIIYPVTNGGLTSTGGDSDNHGLETTNQPQGTQPKAYDENDFEESLKNVAHGFIFPSSPATSHEDIFKQLLEAGSQGPGPEPYVIPTPQKSNKVQQETIITVPQITHAYVLQQPQQPVVAIYSQNQPTNEQIFVSQQMVADEGQQHGANQHYSSDVNVIPIEPQYLQEKPTHYHMVGTHLFSNDVNGDQQREQGVPATSPFREEPSKIPLHPPPPIKASTYGPPQPVPTTTSSHSNHHYPPNHRPAGPARPPQYQNVKGGGLHSKGLPKIRPPHSPYRLHSGPHSHHGHPHHHHHQDNYHRDMYHHYHKQPHLDSHHHARPSQKHNQYEVHETRSPDNAGGGPPHHNRPPLHSNQKHPYNFHYHGPPKHGTYNGPKSPSNSGISSNSRLPHRHPESHRKPPIRHGSQKGAHSYGPPKTPPYSPTSSNSVGGSHPAITKAIFHPTHSPDLTLNQNSGPIKELHGYPSEKHEYDNEPSPTTHATLSYSTASHDSHRPPDATPSASISEPYVTGPPRPTYSDEEDEESSPTVEVYGPMNEHYYGADSYQRIKQTFKPPVIVYKGVRPPVRVYQKPETGPPYHHLPSSHLFRGSTTQNHPPSHSYMPAIESTWANYNIASTPYYHQQRVRGSYSVASPSASSKSSDPPTKSVVEEIHLTTKVPFQYSPSSPSASSPSSQPESHSSSSDDSSSWTPINAPAGAVPARAYHIPAPDLSRGVGIQPINHHSSYYGSANSRADDEDLVLTDRNNNSNSSMSSSSSNSQYIGAGSNQLRRENNSEEVVSAVVLVKH